MRLIDGHILRKVNGNAVLIPPPEKDIGFNGMIVLNDTGELVCKMLRNGADKKCIAEALAQEYEVEPDDAENDLDVFLSELKSCNVLEE